MLMNGHVGFPPEPMPCMLTTNIGEIFMLVGILFAEEALPL